MKFEHTQNNTVYWFWIYANGINEKDVWDKIWYGDTSGVYTVPKNRGFVSYTNVLPFLTSTWHLVMLAKYLLTEVMNKEKWNQEWVYKVFNYKWYF